MQFRARHVAHAASVALLAFSAMTGMGAIEPVGSGTGADAERDRLHALSGTQTEAEIHAVLDSCDPSTVLIDVATGQVLAAIQLPDPRTTFADAVRDPAAALGRGYDVVDFGVNPFIVGSRSLGIYG